MSLKVRDKTKPMVEIFLHVRSEKIGWFRFILEGYDGLATLTTLSVQDGLVRLWTTSGNVQQVFELLADIAPILNRYASPAPLPCQSYS